MLCEATTDDERPAPILRRGYRVEIDRTDHFSRQLGGSARKPVAAAIHDSRSGVVEQRPIDRSLAAQTAQLTLEEGPLTS